MKMVCAKGSVGIVEEHESNLRQCLRCREPLCRGQPVYRNFVGQAWHQECIMREVIGSVGHQRGECSCHGKVDTSEDGMSLRAAAIAAFNYWMDNENKAG